MEPREADNDFVYWCIDDEEGKGEYEVMFREGVRVWSMKFPVAPESARAVVTTHEGHPASEMETRKALAERDDDDRILMPTQETDDHCPCGLWLATHWTPLKLVPLLTRRGAVPQPSLSTPLCVAPTSMGSSSVSRRTKEEGGR